jgi:hypothetical protein
MNFHEWKTEVLFMLGLGMDLAPMTALGAIFEEYPDLDLERNYRANLTVDQYVRKFRSLLGEDFCK